MADERRAARLEAIARLDAELKETATAAESPPLARRFALITAPAFGGWMLGGALVGPSGMAYFAALGLIAGAYRSFTGKPLLESLAGGSNALPGGRMSSFAAPATTSGLPPPPKSSSCGSKPAC